MFEPQDHPDDIPYPGGPPTPPYDATGWTLAFQMGVQFDRDPRRVRRPVREDPGRGHGGARHGHGGEARRGLPDEPSANDTFVATNRLLAAKEDVYWLKSPVTDGTTTYPAGAVYVPAKPTTKAGSTRSRRISG